jgi:PAS domain-containing protein
VAHSQWASAVALERRCRQLYYSVGSGVLLMAMAMALAFLLHYMRSQAPLAEWRLQAAALASAQMLLMVCAWWLVRIVVRSWREQDAHVVALGQARQAAEFNNTVLDQALEMAQCGTWTVDIAQGAVTSPSPRAARLLGMPPGTDRETFIQDHSRCIAEAAGEQVAKEVNQLLRDALHSHSVRYDVKYPIRRMDNRAVMWIHDIATVTRDAMGNPVFMHGVMRDVTLE